jgi:hypothetical protein
LSLVPIIVHSFFPITLAIWSRFIRLSYFKGDWLAGFILLLLRLSICLIVLVAESRLTLCSSCLLSRRFILSPPPFSVGYDVDTLMHSLCPLLS